MEQFSEEEYIEAHQELAETGGLVFDITDTIKESIIVEIEILQDRLENWTDLEGLDDEENQSRKDIVECQLYELQKKLVKIHMDEKLGGNKK